jgi:hypothetical protein
MSDEYSPEVETQSRFPMDAFIPLVLLSLSLIVLLGWQVSNSSAQRTQLENAITRQEPAVNQSNQVQATLGKLAADLLEAAQTDGTARAIAAKYIRKNGDGAGAPGQ